MPFKVAGRGREALLEGCEGLGWVGWTSQGGQECQEALPEGRVWLGGPPEGPGGVGRARRDQ